VVLLDKPSNLIEVSACPRGPKTVLFRLAKLLLEALGTYACYGFYIIIFLNKLKIVENTPIKVEKMIIKRLWLRLWGPP
jgi:hypothetical protein